MPTVLIRDVQMPSPACASRYANICVSDAVAIATTYCQMPLPLVLRVHIDFDFTFIAKCCYQCLSVPVPLSMSPYSLCCSRREVIVCMLVLSS